MNIFKFFKYLFKYGGMPTFEQWQKETYGVVMKNPELQTQEVWHYTCKNGHQWQSYSSPRGTYIYGVEGQTKCPICKTPICKCQSDDGKQGAIHEGFLKNNSKNRKGRKKS